MCVSSTTSSSYTLYAGIHFQLCMLSLYFRVSNSFSKQDICSNGKIRLRCLLSPARRRPQRAASGEQEDSGRRAQRAEGMRARVWLTLLCAVAAGAADGDLRLPRSAWPRRYDLHLTASVCEDAADFSFHGHVDVQIEITQPTTTITLHSKDLNISFPETSLIAIDSEQPIPIVSQDIDKENQFLILQFATTLCADCLYTLHIRFDGLLSTELSGFYRSQYTDRNTGKIKWMGITQLQPAEARRAFPCFDEPEFKATFKISLGRPRACTAISNMPIVSTQPIAGHPEWVLDEFALTERMSTYLVAFVIAELQCARAHGDTRVSVCTREDSLEQAQLALEIGPQVLQYFEKYFDVEYPLPKADMVAVPDFLNGAMENWGLITYREMYILYDEKTSTLRGKYSVASIISHELAHQWFGNLVTLKWWSDVWLNEGFATFVAAMGVHNVFPHWNSRDVEAIEELISIFTMDALPSSHSVSTNISHHKDIYQVFDHISYKKGSLMLRMTSLFLGEDVFRQAVVNYLKRYQYGNAEKDDLYHELTKEARKHNVLSDEMTVKEILEPWITQTGYPVVTARREGTSIILQQNRYLFLRGGRMRHASPNTPCWYIPITYTTQGLRDFVRTKPMAWMSCSEPELTLPNIVNNEEWYIINNHAAGIYRVNYDLENWRQISKTLNSRHFKSIAVMNRMQIVYDVLDFAWTSDINIETAFKVVSYLRRETEYIPWRVAFHNLKKLNRIFIRTAEYNIFMRWVRRLVKPSFERAGGPDAVGDDLHGARHHEQLAQWACGAQLDACLHRTRALFAQWMRTGEPQRNDIIPTNLRSISVCMGVKYGGEQEWDFAWNFYLATNVVNVKTEVLTALGCSGQPWILRRYLSWILDEHGIRKQDATYVFTSVANNEVGFPIAKEFLMAKIADLHKLFGPHNPYLSKWIKAMAEMMFTDEDYGEFSDFTDANRKYLEGSEMAVSQAKETIKDNNRWYKRHFERYVSLLQKYKSSRAAKN